MTSAKYSDDNTIIDCFNHNDLPACKEASADVIVIFSTIDSAKQLIIFLMSPTLGRIADCVGRIPFMHFNAAVFVITQFLFFASVNYGLNFYQFILISVLQGIFPQQTVVIMMVSDKTPKEFRMSLFGVIFMGMFATLPLCTILVSKLGIMNTSYIMYGFTVISSILVLSMKETLVNLVHFDIMTTINPFINLSILFRSTTFMSLAFVMFCNYLSMEGYFNVLKFQCFDILHFNQDDLSTMQIAIAASCFIFNMPILTTYLSKNLGHKMILIVASGWSVIIHIQLGLVSEKHAFIVGMFFSCFSIISTPTIFAVKSNLCDDTEQGLIQGALGAVQNVGSGVGPLLFSQVQKYSEKRNAFFLQSFIYFIGLIALIFGVKLDKNQIKDDKAISVKNEGGDEQLVKSELERKNDISVVMKKR